MSNDAVNRFITQHRDTIKLVIASNPFRKHGGGSGKRLSQQLRHSGIRFFLFLAYSFFLFPLLLKTNYVLCRLLGRTSDLIPIKKHSQHYDIACQSSDDVNDGQLEQLLRDHNIDLLITCFFDQILHPAIIKAPHIACLNIHPGLLPECRGVFPEFHTAAGKCPAFGITIHMIDDATIDSGRILLKKNIDRLDRRSMLAIGRELLTEGLGALDEVLADWDNRLGLAESQGAGNYYSFPSRADIGKLTKAGYALIRIEDILTDIIQVGVGH